MEGYSPEREESQYSLCSNPAAHSAPNMLHIFSLNWASVHSDLVVSNKGCSSGSVLPSIPNMGKGTRRRRWILKGTCLWVFVRQGRRCEEEYCEGWLRATNSRGSEQDDQLYFLCYRQQAIHPDQLFEWNSGYIFYTNRKKILNRYVMDWWRDIYLKLAKNIFPIQ